MALITAKQAATRLGVSRSTVERLTAEGKFVPCYQFSPRNRRFDEKDVERWIESRRKTTEQKEPA